MEPNGAPMPRLALSSATSSTWLSSSGDSMAEAISATTVSSSMRCRRFLAAIALSVCVSSLARCGVDLQDQSCLMQDEPGGRGCFACKMSLERGSAMLGIDDQSEQQTGNEPGRDPGFFESQRSRAFRRREKGGGLRDYKVTGDRKS